MRKEKSLLLNNFRKKNKILLVYPNTYYVGMSNLGFQTIYKILNSREDIFCERAFLEDDFSKPKSLENNRFAAEFDVIIFSISFEIDFFNVIKFLKLSGFPLKRKERADFPPVIAGGIAITLNYKPLLNIVDYFITGDGEESVCETVNSLLKGEKPQNITGVVSSEENNVTSRAIYRGDIICHSVIATENTEFSNTLLVEIARGCPYKCNFCAVSYNCAPYRIHKTGKIKEIIEKSLPVFDKVGIVGASVTSHPEFIDLCKWLNSKNIPFSITSLRLDTVSDNLIEELIKGGNNTFAVAVESCSEDLRKRINKRLSDSEIFDAMEKFINHKVLNLKIYIIVGLPYETFEHVEKIVTFVRRIKEMYLMKRKELKNLGSITVSVNPFIPKSNTPFFEFKMDNEESLTNKIKFLLKHLNKIPNVKMVCEDIYRAYMQGLLSKGDEKITNLFIEKALNNISHKRFFKKYYNVYENYKVV